MDSAFAAAVHAVVRATEPGQVLAFGEVAAEAGRPGAARAVGQLMAGSDGSLPWWRIVYADGRLPPIAPAEQASRLRAEGVMIVGDRVRRPG